jgi:hypothetical protein
MMENFKLLHRLDLPAVPYRGTPQSLTAVIAGEVPIVLDSLGASSSHTAGGRPRALAVTSRRRAERLPEVPTVLETGLDPRSTAHAAVDRISTHRPHATSQCKMNTRPCQALASRTDEGHSRHDAAMAEPAMGRSPW